MGSKGRRVGGEERMKAAAPDSRGVRARRKFAPLSFRARVMPSSL